MILFVFFVVGTIVMMFLPETLHQKLPETLRDAEQFGKTQPFWYLPRPDHKPSGASGQYANGDTKITAEKELLEKLNQPQFST